VDPKAPDWLRNLDKNSDGKLSRAEFVGTDEQFKRYDTDGDGFISRAEVEATDAEFRNHVPR
jgi:Ca2+-binding EF-hand superfamily protein